MINFYFCWWATRFVKNKKEVVFSACFHNILRLCFSSSSLSLSFSSIFLSSSTLFLTLPHSLSVSDFLPLTISLFFFPSISNCQFIFFPTLLLYFSFALFHFFRIEFIDVDERAGPWSVECRESFR